MEQEDASKLLKTASYNLKEISQICGALELLGICTDHGDRVTSQVRQSKLRNGKISADIVDGAPRILE